MKNQSLFLPEMPGEREMEQKGFFRRMIQGWLRLSGPRRERFSTSIEDQELLRRSRLLSGLFSLIIVVVIVAAPTAIPVPSYWTPIIVFLVLSLIALFLNRAAQVTLSAIFYILAIDVTLAILMITLPTGIRNSNIPDFDFFIIPILIGGVVLPRYLVPLLAAVHICLIIGLFTLLPHDPLLTQEIIVNQKGFAYSELSDALIIQLVGAMVAWLGAWSVDRALLRASRAEDLAEAHRRINEQARQIVDQKDRLDYGINILKDAHARFANGDYRARAKLQDNELTSLAFSFNLMAERLNRITQIAQEHARLEQGLRQLLEIQNTVIHGGAVKVSRPTGTLADHLFPSFQRYAQLQRRIAQSGSTIEKVRSNLTQQKALLSQLTSVLTQVFTLTQQLSSGSKAAQDSYVQFLEQAQKLCAQIDDQERQCLQETLQLDHLLREATVVHPGISAHIRNGFVGG